ncbi:hypothetical protein ECoL_03649 [Escherichia coli EC4100B]|nr:hypothetical protein ECoL_03649 [Escherichia coli EC4100B]
MAADKMAAQTLRIITSRFSAIKKGVIPDAIYWGYKYFNEY